MGKAVWKCTLSVGGFTDLLLPVGAKPLLVALQRGVLCLWVEVEPGKGCQEVRRFDVYGTGHPIMSVKPCYVGTCFDGPLVWHVFESEVG